MRTTFHAPAQTAVNRNVYIKRQQATLRLLSLSCLVGLFGAITSANAGSTDHYTPGVMNIRDFFVPGPGWYVTVYNYFYTSDQLNDANGNEISSVTIKPGPGPGPGPGGRKHSASISRRRWRWPGVSASALTTS